ncbi:PREDICTED: uncharacterized protein LOC104814600 [Tarenaya hassleriana]|uniref:uncharacterized protein LOC104814600 n=1 Tax=Tarenaya hassleriana TaxID=28532 RepID=UPI00053C96C1|nr:PREDICTED: uncharacterized protein LOC104814600 [Tarenaya hassleriana]
MKKVLHRSFKPAKCKTALQMASSRLKILKNKKDVQIKQLRKELAQLLESGQTQTARIRVEHVVREEKTIAAYELVGIYCELLVARLAVIESQKNCPNDLKEAVASVLYASRRLADVPELSDVVKHFSAKYGKDFASAAVELRPDSGVSRLLAEKLSVKAPDGPTKVKILTEIAEQHNIKWEAKSLMETDPKDAEVLRDQPSSFESASRKHADSPKVPDKEPPNFQVPPSSSERNRVPSSSYPCDERSSDHLHSAAPPDVNLGKTSDSYHPNARPSGDRTHGGEYRHPNSGDGDSSPTSRRKWEMEFKDATAAARAAAESAERASIAARAAAELSSKERMMRQNSADSPISSPSFNNRNEHQPKRISSNVQSEDRPSPRRNVTQYQEMSSTKHDNFTGSTGSECSSDDELSGNARGRRGRDSQENLETRRSGSFAKSGREKKQPSEPDRNIDYMDEVQLSKKSSRASSRSHSRTFSDDHIVASDLVKSPSLEENIFATDDSHQPQRSPEETFHHDSGHAAASFDEYGSFFDKPQFDKEDTYNNDEPDYVSGFSLLGDKTPAREGTNPGKYRSSSKVFEEKPTSPVFDDGPSTGPAVPFHEAEQSAKFDAYGPDSESEVDEPSNKAGISGGKPVEERSKATTSLSSPRFQYTDEAEHDFFPSDTDEPVYDTRAREDSDLETQMGLRFGALTGGLKNKKTLPPYRMSPARDTTLSKPEKEYTETNIDQAMSSSPSVSSTRKELYTEKKPVYAPHDASSSDDEDSAMEPPQRTSITLEDSRIKTQTRVSYLHSRTSDDDSEEGGDSIGNQERRINKQTTTGGKDNKRQNAKTQASSALNLSSPFGDDEDENEAREFAPRTKAKPMTGGLSRRTKGPGKAPVKSSTSETTVTAKTDKEQTPSTSLPKVVTSADDSSVETPSKERASHVHPKLPDYDNLLASLASRRPNRR